MGAGNATKNAGEGVLWSQPLLLSVLAGASTCLGAAVVLVRKSSAPLRKAHLAGALSLAGSVMMTVSLFSLLPEAFEGKNGELLDIMSYGMLQRVSSFVFGCILYALLSKCAFPEPEAILGFEEESSSDKQHNNINDRDGVPLVAEHKKDSSKPLSTLRIRSQASSNIGMAKDEENQSSKRVPGSVESSTTMDEHLSANSPKTASSPTSKRDTSSSWNSYSSGADLGSTDARRAWRVTLLLFVSLAVHNFPEGLAVAASSLHSPHLGLTTAVAIGLHNIPEGIAIAIPCLAARPDSPYLAFGLASLSGLTEPLGALVALTVLQVDMESMGNWLSFVASIMISVAVWELFPEGWRNAVADSPQDGKTAFWVGTALGFVIMVGSDAVLDQSIEE